MNAYMAAQNACMICKQKSTVHNEEMRLRALKNNLEKLTASASEKDKEEQERQLRRNPGLLFIFYEHHRCKYGMHCTKINTLTLKWLSEETSKLFVLACVMGKKLRDETMLSGYPKAYNYKRRIKETKDKKKDGK